MLESLRAFGARHQTRGFRNPVLKQIEKNAEIAKIDENNWLMMGSSLENYAYDFDKVLPQSFPSFLKEYKKGHRKWFLDLMANEAAVRNAVQNYDFSGGLAVSLGCAHNESPIEDHPEALVETINRDLLYKSTWQEIRKFTNDKGISGFDVVTARPIAGIHNLTKDTNVLCGLLRRAWAVTNSAGGALFFQVPTVAGSAFERYVEKLKEEGISATISRAQDEDARAYVRRSAVVFRTPSSPRVLPKM